MKNRINWGLTGATFLGSLVAAVVMIAIKDQGVEAADSLVFWTGTFFAVMYLLSSIALQCYAIFNRKYRIQRSKLWLPVMLLVALLLWGVGAGGQYLFMLSKDKEEEVVETVTVKSEVDMVMLIDCSISMKSNDRLGTAIDAACQFVDYLDDTTKLQVVSFGSTVLDTSDFCVMDSDGKSKMKTMIQSLVSSGGTDFNEPLERAYDHLTGSEARSDSQKAVIILTDGEASILDNVKSKYTSSDIKLFSVRVGNQRESASDVKALIDLAEKTGGTDTQISERGGSADTTELFRAFADAFEATVDEVTTVVEPAVPVRGTIVHSEQNVTIWQIFIRTLTLTICSILFGCGYFARLTIKSMIADGVMGAVISVLICIVEVAGAFACALVLCALMGTAYVRMNMTGAQEESFDV